MNPDGIITLLSDLRLGDDVEIEHNRRDSFSQQLVVDVGFVVGLRHDEVVIAGPDPFRSPRDMRLSLRAISYEDMLGYRVRTKKDYANPEGIPALLSDLRLGDFVGIEHNRRGILPFFSQKTVKDLGFVVGLGYKDIAIADSNPLRRPTPSDMRLPVQEISYGDLLAYQVISRMDYPRK